MPEIANIGIITAFVAGIVSFLSPCVLPLVPGYVSFIAGKSLEDVRQGKDVRSRLDVLWLSFNFVVGFSAVFIALGATATFFGQALLSYSYEAGIIAGIVIFLFGIHMMGLLRLGWLNRDWRWQGNAENGTPLGAQVLGMAFAFGWTPCIGPILGAILTLSAATASVSQGIALLAIYSLGLAIPFMLVALFTSSFLKRLRGLGRGALAIHKFSGGVLAIVGIAMMTGTLNWAGTWLLDTFPFMQELII
jgi:cytochrome c-type biogenesis protein